ncbi:MAG TPA: hypothetical protein VEY95_13615 [Azospirillaceae bacterium]|nr:hypothetical protein [Azospirillaceae bacterium]
MAEAFPRFLAGLAAGLLACAGVLAGGVTLLAAKWPQHLPPPAITNRVDFDEKLRRLRDGPPMDPEVLAVGSSLTLQHFDGAAFGPPGKAYNGATWGVQMNQIGYLTGWYLSRFPHVRQLVVMTGPADFRNCDAPTRFFDPGDAAAFIERRYPLAYFYGKYFDPVGFLTKAVEMADARRDPEKLRRDAYESQPRRTVPAGFLRTRGLFYGLIHPDPSCFEAFEDLVEDVRARGIEVAVVLPPINPAYFEQIPGTREAVAALVDRIGESLGDKGGVRIIDLRATPVAASDFFDAFHMRWDIAQAVSHQAAVAAGPPQAASR